MIYLPEILPLSGVTIAIFFKAIGRNFEFLFRLTGVYSPLIMIGFLVLVFFVRYIILK